VVTPLIALPDESFLEAIEAFVPAADSLFWDEKILSLEHLVRAREAVSDRLKQCRLWRWRKDELTDTVARDIASGLRALFFHTPVSFTDAVCYLPIGASPLLAVLPALAALTQDASGLSFVAALVHSTGPGMVGCSPFSGSDYPDAIQTQRRPPPPHPEDVVQGAELAGLRSGPAPARQPDVVD
jgi:hypothetical protein